MSTIHDMRETGEAAAAETTKSLRCDRCGHHWALVSGQLGHQHVGCGGYFRTYDAARRIIDHARSTSTRSTR